MNSSIGMSYLLNQIQQLDSLCSKLYYKTFGPPYVTINIYEWHLKRRVFSVIFLNKFVWFFHGKNRSKGWGLNGGWKFEKNEYTGEIYLSLWLAKGFFLYKYPIEALQR